jgi:two-component system, OmpR family, response regulator TctD
MQLLIVEDDAAMRSALTRTFERRGFGVTALADGRDALAQLKARPFDACLLDLTLPGLDGFAVLQKARNAQVTTPILILTARGAVGDRIQGLNAGADDYLAKPFDLDELEARVHALMRRGKTEEARAVQVGALTWHNDSGVGYLRGEPLELTPREQALMTALIAKLGQAVPKERLTRQVFPFDDAIAPDAIEVVAFRLRKKLSGSGAELVTLRGLGYLLRAVPPT